MSVALTSRRDFIKIFALTTAFGSLAKESWSGTLLAEVRAANAPASGTLRINVSDFPTLAEDFGSVRIGTSSLSGNYPRGLFYPILVNRAPGNQFHALNAACTHEGCVVRVYNKAAGASVCPCHTSRFGIDGERISGPASFPLLSYNTTLDSKNFLTIELPDFPHQVDSIVVQNGLEMGSRVQLKFFAFIGMEFEVFFRESLSAAWKVILFSTTASGPLSQSVINGRDNTATVYVERSSETGFYAIAIRLKQL